MSITLYDIPAAVPGKTLSPNVFKTRLALAYKGLSFKTEWLELSEIETKMREIGADPTSTWEDGRPLYTLPVIRDHTTGRIVSDSTKIAFYLDDVYPDRPPLFPFHARAPIMMVNEFFAPTAMLPGGDMFSHGAFKRFAPPSIEYIRRTRGEEFLTRVRSFSAEEQERRWPAVREGFSKVAKMLDANGNGEDKIFFYGDKPSFADFIVIGYLHYIEVSLGAESVEWKEVQEWDGGRWAKMLRFSEKLKVLGEE
ncbi:hypothetical protein SCHPADRAFT_820382 [Schizopora paradoxa]|uniref:GST N-terminal domain-containing protein n=1 Tax=Schizopora paradoxa TaxID=27342 RepID=A0A0H2S8Q1_9AGAM|nr:hypothetical protein SCHPADRAFT_820382 [Schizopora paradoxa]